MNAWIIVTSLLAQTDLLAQADPAGGAPIGPTTPVQPAPTAGMGLFFALMMGMIVFMFLNQRSQTKRRERERQQLYAGLNKNDRVLTVGGVIGTVHAVKDHEVILKVDESTNTKMAFVKSAIQRVIHDDSDVKLDAN